MKKIIIVLASAILTVFLALFFFLTPTQVISKISDLQQEAVLTAGKSSGNFLTGYRYEKTTLTKNDGTRLLGIDEMTLDIHLLPLILGRIGIDIHSKELTAALTAGFDGSLKGEASFNGLPFDTAAFMPPTDVSFTAPISGRVIVSGRRTDIEVRADEIRWKRLSVSGFDLPLDMFEKGKGSIAIEQSRIIVKSLGFEGGKGYARLSGEIITGQRRLMLELFPNDWDDFMLMPLERYKVSPGQYKIPLDF